MARSGQSCLGELFNRRMAENRTCIRCPLAKPGTPIEAGGIRRHTDLLLLAIRIILQRAIPHARVRAGQSVEFSPERSTSADWAANGVARSNQPFTRLMSEGRSIGGGRQVIGPRGWPDCGARSTRFPSDRRSRGADRFASLRQRDRKRRGFCSQGALQKRRRAATAGRFAYGDTGGALHAGATVRVTVTATDRPGHTGVKTETRG
jgi:hypothetical protein